MRVELTTDRFTVNNRDKTLTAFLSDFTRAYLPQCIDIKSHKTGKSFPFSTTALDEIWRESEEERELVGWKYHSAWLPGWTVVIFND